MDNVTRPSHYTMYPVEVKEITRHLGFCLGNAVKYILRAPYKGSQEDCLKAVEYLFMENELPQDRISHAKYILLNESLDKLADFLIQSGDPLWEDIAEAQLDFLNILDDYLCKLPDNKCNLLDIMIDIAKRLGEILKLRDSGEKYKGLSGVACVR